MAGTVSVEIITYKGEEYIYTGKSHDRGAIATPEQLSKCLPSFAYLGRDGKVRRCREVIGSREDVVFTGRFMEVTFHEDFAENFFNHPGWEGKPS